MKKEQNPFVQEAVKYIEKTYVNRVTFYVLSTDLLPTLYERFGVRSFEELFPSRVDLERYMKLIRIGALDPQLKLEDVEIESEEDIDVTMYVSLHVVYLSGFYVTDEELANIEGRLARRGAVGTEYENMSKDVFGHVVLVGKLTGPDLIAVCSASKKARDKCDDALMKRLLKKEFGSLFFDGAKGVENPFEIYVLLHKVKYNLNVFLTKAAFMQSSLEQKTFGTFRYSSKKSESHVFDWMYYKQGFLFELFSGPTGTKALELYPKVEGLSMYEERLFFSYVSGVLNTKISDEKLRRMIKRQMGSIGRNQSAIDGIVALHKLIRDRLIDYMMLTKEFHTIFGRSKAGPLSIPD